MLTKPIVMLDFETTGLSPDMGDRITEVAALRIVDGLVAERFVSLVNCGTRIPSYVTALTGISQRMVDAAPPVAQVLPRLLEFIGTDTLAAHNASFDEKFLQAECQRQHLAARHRGLVCSLKLARRMLPGQASYKLGGLAQSLKLRFNGTAHRAEADAEVSAQLLMHIGERLCHRYDRRAVAPSLLEAINRQSAAKVGDYLSRALSVAA
jgi:DNA polymerase-3 subunit epsilon